MKSDYKFRKGGVSCFIKDNKPKNSLNLSKWFSKGGSVEISESKGKQTWKYSMVKNGDTYFAIYDSNDNIIFSDNFLHSQIKQIDIGEFAGDNFVWTF